MVAEFKREKIVSQIRRTDERKSLTLHSVPESRVRIAPQHM